MKILVACEESQLVCIEFRKRGYEAYSCDILPCSGEHPEWHIQGDVLPLLKQKWDLIIAFPPCTHLAVSGAKHFEKKRLDGRQREGIEFFCQFLNLDCPHVSIENPVNIIAGDYIREHFPDLSAKYHLPIKPTQVIQPYEYGHDSKKTTCLWLKGLPKLQPTKIVKPDLITYTRGDGSKATFSRNYCQVLGKNRAITRSKTYKGVAEAMANQWGKYIEGRNKWI